jgi:hypothetical protein
LRYIDPDGADPKSLTVIVQNLTMSSTDTNDTRSTRIATTAALVTRGIENSYAGGGGASEMLAFGGARARVTSTSSTTRPRFGGSGIHIVLADLATSSTGRQNPKSFEMARSVGAGVLVSSMSGVKQKVAVSELNGNRTIIAIDRVLEKIDRAKLDINDPSDQAKIIELVEQYLAPHELGHLLGLDDNSEFRDLTMNGSMPSFSDEIITAKMRGEMDQIHRGVLKKTAQ